MPLTNAFALLYDPSEQWKIIASESRSVSDILFKFLVFFAAIPPVSAFIGSTYVGWSVGNSETYRITTESAFYLSVAAYLAIISGVFIVSYLVKWMANSYGAAPTFGRCFNLTAYSFTPLFLAGILGSFPILWLDMLVTLVAMAMSVNLLYKGVSIMMEIGREQGFLFAGSILTVCMVCLMGMFAVTVVFWGSGLSPVYIS